MRKLLPLSRCRLAFALAMLVALGIGAYGGLPALAPGAAYLLPALLLLMALAARRYPGERALLAVLGILRRRRPRVPREGGACREGARRCIFPRGGALIASSLAERAPPPGAAALR